MRKGWMIFLAITSSWAVLRAGDTVRGDSRLAATPFIQAHYHNGVTWSRTEYLEEQFKGGNQGFDLRVGFQSSGKRYWQQAYKYPSFGAGIHYADLVRDPADTIVGNPWSVFLFYTSPWVRFGRVTLGTDAALGLSHTARIHHPVHNPFNDVIASRVNLFFDFNIHLEFALSKQLAFSSGYGITHYSNGGIHQPQKGVNNWGWVLGLRYWFSEPLPESASSDTRIPGPEDYGFSPSESLQLMLAAGTVEWHRLGDEEGIRFFTSSFTADYAFRYSFKSAVTVGADILYDGSLARAIKGIEPEDVTPFQKTYLGGHIGYQRVIDRVTLLFNLGTYFLQHSYDRGFIFSRLGGRIRITDPIHLHVTIKTKNGIRSDWIEWGLAYHLETR